MGPADWNFDETLSTLRYASRAKHITNKPRVNEDPKDAMLREFQQEILRLREALQVGSSGGPAAGAGQQLHTAGLATDSACAHGRGRGARGLDQEPAAAACCLLQAAEGTDGAALPEDEGGEGGEGGGGGGGEVVVERVVEVPKQLAPEEVEQLRSDMEQQLRQELQVGGWWLVWAAAAGQARMPLYPQQPPARASSRGRLEAECRCLGAAGAAGRRRGHQPGAGGPGAG